MRKKTISRKDLCKVLVAVQRRQLEEADYRLLEKIVEDWAVFKGIARRHQPIQPHLKPEDAEATAPDSSSEEGKASEPSKAKGSVSKPKGSSSPKKKAKGHGRRSRRDYPGAVRLHFGFEPGELPPSCCEHPDLEIRTKEHLVFVGFPPIMAFLLQVETGSCVCGTVTRPTKTPHGLLHRKYHPSAVAMTTLLRHWYGVPNYRQEVIQNQMGVPLPDATQADLIKSMEEVAEPVFQRLRHLAAQADVLFVDDTSARIVSRIRTANLEPEKKRTASHATGTVAHTPHGPVCMYEIGANHAGENLQALLEARASNRPPPLIMNDGSACNTDHTHRAIHLNCMFHFRQKIEKCQAAFPEETADILHLIGLLYDHERQAKALNLKDRPLLDFRRCHSTPVVNELYGYCTKLVASKQVEPNSNLGDAIEYALKRWTALTGFLRIENAPLDNLPAERLFKPFALVRKNSLFYKDPAGARRASTLMSLAATAVAHKVNTLAYFTALYTHESDVARRPEAWMPWNFGERLTLLEPGPTSPALATGRHSSAKSAFSGFPFHNSVLSSLAANSAKT